MILTCPRCATRYLADDTQVWSTGRTVQCGGCGQRWRAFGGGVDPRSPAAGDAEAPATAAAPPPVEAFAAAPPPSGEGCKDGSPPVEAPPPDAPAVAAAVPEDRSPAPGLFVTQPPRAAKAVREGPPGVRAAQAILVIVLALVLAVVFRDAIVKRAPALGAVYRAVGVPTGPELGPHG